MTARGRARRVAASAAIAVAAMACVAAPVHPSAGAATAAAAVVCAPVAGGAGRAVVPVVVPIVVDFGTGQPGGVTALCVPADAAQSASDILEARARMLGVPAPRYADSGLLCGIDGVPETGCGERTSSGYRYWSYWKGESGTWLYQTLGPADRRAGDGIVEGWRFQTGEGSGKDQPPRRSPTRPIPAAGVGVTTTGAAAVASSRPVRPQTSSVRWGNLIVPVAVVLAVAGAAVAVTRRRRRAEGRGA